MGNSLNHLREEISRLREEKGAFIMAHNYQAAEIQDAADFTGDSLAMARRATEVREDLLVVCGVYFMAETAAVLNPEKTVLIPDPAAGCPLADYASEEKVRDWRSRYPDHAFVTYVNSSAGVKALSDVCCTSSNALRIVDGLDGDRVVFLPDKNLGGYVAEQTSKEVVLWPGCCPVHDQMTRDRVEESRRAHPDALVLAHPECPREVRQGADGICSTGQMFSFIQERPEAGEFLIVTEGRMIHALEKAFPDRRFYEPAGGITCRNMGKITLEKLRRTLEEGVYPVEVAPETAGPAARAIRRMLELS